MSDVRARYNAVETRPRDPRSAGRPRLAGRDAMSAMPDLRVLDHTPAGASPRGTSVLAHLAFVTEATRCPIRASETTHLTAVEGILEAPLLPLVAISATDGSPEAEVMPRSPNSGPAPSEQTSSLAASGTARSTTGHFVIAGYTHVSRRSPVPPRRCRGTGKRRPSGSLVAGLQLSNQIRRNTSMPRSGSPPVDLRVPGRRGGRGDKHIWPRKARASQSLLEVMPTASHPRSCGSSTASSPAGAPPRSADTTSAPSCDRPR